MDRSKPRRSPRRTIVKGRCRNGRRCNVQLTQKPQATEGARFGPLLLRHPSQRAHRRDLALALGPTLPDPTRSPPVFLGRLINISLQGEQRNNQAEHHQHPHQHHQPAANRKQSSANKHQTPGVYSPSPRARPVRRPPTPRPPTPRPPTASHLGERRGLAGAVVGARALLLPQFRQLLDVANGGQGAVRELPLPLCRQEGTSVCRPLFLLVLFLPASALCRFLSPIPDPRSKHRQEDRIGSESRGDTDASGKRKSGGERAIENGPKRPVLGSCSCTRR